MDKHRRDIFISYSHADGAAVAHALHDGLVSRGFRVWFDRISLSAGGELKKPILQRITDCTAFVPILTPEYALAHKWSMIEFRHALAVQKQKLKQDGTHPFVFPIVHELPPSEIRKSTFMLGYLRDRMYLNSERPIDELVTEIMKGMAVREDVLVPANKEGLSIGRFPVTNLEYRRFINAGGYKRLGLETWWSEAGRDFWLHYAVRSTHKYFGWGEQAKRTEDTPILTNMTADNLLYNGYGQPVTGVSYFEAEAYCNWLTSKIGGQFRARLPTEAEWWLAANKPGDRFPWGNSPPTPILINMVDKASEFSEELTLDQLDLDRLATVNLPNIYGAYPRGQSVNGCQDMFGNVWEWLGDWLSEEEAFAQSSHLHNRAKIAGNCCFDMLERFENPIALRKPGFRHHVIGFRIVAEGLAEALPISRKRNILQRIFGK